MRLRELEDSIQLVKKQGEVRRLSSLVQQKEREMRQKGFDQFEQYVCIRTYVKVYSPRQGYFNGEEGSNR